MQKRVKVRLKGEALNALNTAIHERDNYICICCTNYVPIGEKFHHEPGGANKQDTMQTGLLLCYECHQERHFGKDTQEYKERCEGYLRGLYGG